MHGITRPGRNSAERAKRPSTGDGKEEKQFHIDVFYPPAALSMTSELLGTYQRYVGENVSDHVPLIVDFEFE